MIYLSVFGGAAAFFLWVLALPMTTPTRVANTMTVNPIAASLLAAVIVSEPSGGPVGASAQLRPEFGSPRLQAKKMSRAKALLEYLLAPGPLTRPGF